MTHGTPDWGVTAGRVTTYQLTDLAEAVARLGSTVTFDRRGDVLFLDSFEEGIDKWTSQLFGYGSAFDLSMVRARSGLYSARLTAGSGAQPAVNMYIRRPYPVLSAFGFEFSFARETGITRIYASLEQYDGDDKITMSARYTAADKVVEVYDSGGDYQAALTVETLPSDKQFNTFKLVADPSVPRYERVILNEQAAALTDIAPYTMPYPATTPHVEVCIAVLGTAGSNLIVYVDDVILTQNEPVS